jgi:hypothetical protein
MDHPPKFPVYCGAGMDVSPWRQFRIGVLRALGVSLTKPPDGVCGKARPEFAAVVFALHEIMGTVPAVDVILIR